MIPWLPEPERIIVSKGVDNTIANIGVLAKEGMRQTDQTILSMLERLLHTQEVTGSSPAVSTRKIP